VLTNVVSEIRQLQDVFDGALFGDFTALLGVLVEDQVLLLRFDGKRELVRLALRDSCYCAYSALIEGLASLVERIRA